MAAISLVADFSLNDSAYVERAAQASQEYRAQSNRQIAECYQPTITKREKCIDDADDAYEQQRREEYNLAAQQTSAWWTKVAGAAAIFAGAVGSITVLLIFMTFWQTLKQGAQIAQSVVHHERSATAMEGVAESMKINAAKIVESVEHQKIFGRMQMRAYVSVGLDERPVYQDQRLRFGASPTLLNTGHTPALNLRWQTTAIIAPFPLEAGYQFRVPPQGEGQSILMPHQGGRMECTLPDRIADDLAEKVMGRDTLAFYVWGIVTYMDVFGDEHETKFAQVYSWWRSLELREDGLVLVHSAGQFLPWHNEAN
jgi:hypothetical protein